MAVRKNARGRWEASIYNPRTRGKRWAGTHATRTEAKAAERRAYEDRDKPDLPETVESYSLVWLDENPRQRESTNRTLTEGIRPFVREFGHRKLDSIDRREAKKWALQHRYSAKAARSMLTDAKNDGLLNENPFVGLRLPGSARRVEVPTSAEVDALARAAEMVWDDYGRRVYGPLIRFAAYTGLRPGEIYGLRWGDVDFANNRLSVERQFNGRLAKCTPTKNGKPRVVLLLAPASEALLLQPRGEYIWRTPTGKRFTGGSQGHYFHPVRAAIGRPELEFYSLRHHFGSYLAGLGATPYDIAKMMGHQDGGQLAMQRYIHVTAEESMDRLAKLASPPRLVDVSTEKSSEIA